MSTIPAVLHICRDVHALPVTLHHGWSAGGNALPTLALLIRLATPEAEATVTAFAAHAIGTHLTSLRRPLAAPAATAAGGFVLVLETATPATAPGPFRPRRRLVVRWPTRIRWRLLATLPGLRQLLMFPSIPGLRRASALVSFGGDCLDPEGQKP